MKEKKVKRIDLSRKRLARLADHKYNEGEYLTALRFAHRERLEYGGDPDVFVRLCDIYEGLGLQGSAINYWFQFLNVADEEEYPDIYEGLANNYLAIGNDRQAAYYFNLLIDADDSIPEETKMDIADAFAVDKRSQFRFVYPPKAADYSKEVSLGSKALKSGNTQRAVEILEGVAKGSKEYSQAKEMQAVAYLLAGDTKVAEKVCTDLLQEEPEAIRVLSTLAAVYLEQGRTEESLAIAKNLSKLTVTEQDDLYKVATVFCENGLHEDAYRCFVELDEKLPHDGRMLYFKGVSAYKSGRIEDAERALDELCTLYPDAEVAKYYLRQIREYQEGKARGETPTPPELIYFYHLPQEERESRCEILLKIGSCPKEEANLFGLIALHDGYFAWCFDEMDGGDRDLQYLALVTAAHVRADEFLQDVLLDFEVADVLKVEILRMLLERNEDMEVGLVLCHIYKRVPLFRISIGRKRRKKYIDGYARIASKFGVIDERYSKKIKEAAELLYRALEEKGGLDLIDNPDDCACAIYLLTGLHDLGKDQKWIASAFDANVDRVRVLLSYAIQEKTREEKSNEID